MDTLLGIPYPKWVIKQPIHPSSGRPKGDTQFRHCSPRGAQMDQLLCDPSLSPAATRALPPAPCGSPIPTPSAPTDPPAPLPDLCPWRRTRRRAAGRRDRRITSGAGAHWFLRASRSCGTAAPVRLPLLRVATLLLP